MAHSKPGVRSGVISVAVALFVWIVKPGNTTVALACSGMFVCLLYGLSRYPYTSTNTFVIVMRWLVLLAVCGGVSGGTAYYCWKRWRLTDEQSEVIVRMAKQMPKRLTVIVQGPPHNELGRQMAADIRQRLEDGKATVNHMAIIYSLIPEFTGIRVYVAMPEYPNTDPGCPSYTRGLELSSAMALSGIKSEVVYEPNYRCSEMAVVVGSKPAE